MNQNKLYGAILGDLAGQPYEFKYKGDFSEFNIHDDRSTFTDDTIMTLATAEAFSKEDYPLRENFEDMYKWFANVYKGDYYGQMFKEWVNSPDGTVGTSWGNGAIMRLSPIMYAYESEDFRFKIALESAFTSHFSIEVYEAVKRYVFTFEHMDLYQDRLKTGRYQNHKVRTFDKLDSSAATTIDFMSEVIRKATSTHEAIEIAVKAGGDTDTNASILGELFASHYNDITEEDKKYVESKLDPYLLNTLTEFNKKFK